MVEIKNNLFKEQPKAGGDQEQKPIDDATRIVFGKFDEKKDEQVKRVEELFEKRISSSKMAEIALTEVRGMKEQQKIVVAETFERFKKKYQDQSEQNITLRNELASQLLQEAESVVDARIQSIELVLNSLVKGDYITETEAASLKRILVGIEEISTKDIQVQQILIKLKDKNEQLSDDDYRRIVDMINPLNITDKDAKPQQRFEATTAGILIGFMSGAQRYKLMETYMDSPKREKTAEVIDGFLRSGVLTIAQGEELFIAAMQKKLITEDEFKNTYQKRLNEGFYVDEVKKVRDAMEAEVQRMKGMYAINPMERVVGAPLLGAGMLLHSFFWILTNVLASGGDFKAMFKNNPYIWAALGEGALALEMTSGSMKKGAGSFGIGSGWISRAVERISEKEGALSSVKQNAYLEMGNIYLGSPDFGSYLENGGAYTIMQLRKTKSAQGAEGAKLMISYDELYNFETSDTQKSRLLDVHKKFPQKTLENINSIGEAVAILEMETQDDFNSKLAFIKEEQGLKRGPAGNPPGALASGPSAGPQVVLS